MLTKAKPSLLAVDQFQSKLLEVCGLFHAEPPKGQETVTGDVMHETRAEIEIAHVSKNLQKISRTAIDCRRDSAEHYFLVIQEEGSALMAQSETARMMNPGDMILIDSAKPSEFTFFGTFGRQISLHLPRVEMRQRFGDNIRNGLFVPRTDYAATALVAVLAKAFSNDGSDDQSPYLKEALYGLLGVILHEKELRDSYAGIEADVAGAQLLKRALAHIDFNFADSNLSIQQIANELHVSMRQLQRAFLLLGTTPTDYLAQKRLEMACQMLLDRRAGKVNMLVSSIAYSCGFNDVSYFNRQFRTAFGCPPGQYGE